MDRIEEEDKKKEETVKLMREKLKSWKSQETKPGLLNTCTKNHKDAGERNKEPMGICV